MVLLIGQLITIFTSPQIEVVSLGNIKSGASNITINPKENS